MKAFLHALGILMMLAIIPIGLHYEGMTKCWECYPPGMFLGMAILGFSGLVLALTSYWFMLKLIVISIVLSVMPAQAQVRPILPFTLDPRQESGNIVIRDRQGNLTIGDYNNRTGDLFLFDTKSGHITTGTRDSFGDWTINEYKGFDHSGDDD